MEALKEETGGPYCRKLQYYTTYCFPEDCGYSGSLTGTVAQILLHYKVPQFKLTCNWHQSPYNNEMDECVNKQHLLYAFVQRNPPIVCHNTKVTLYPKYINEIGITNIICVLTVTHKSMTLCFACLPLSLSLSLANISVLLF
jgi:hypothetical protein